MKSTGLYLFLSLAAFSLAGCNKVETPKVAPVQQTSPAPSAVIAPVSINALMVGMVDHGAHALWDVEITGRKGIGPKNDKEWREIEHHAIQLAGAGALISSGGTGPLDAEWSKSPDWKKFAKQLSDVGLEARKEAHDKDLKGLINTNDKLVATCQQCHDEFKPGLPTEGIVHPHDD